MSEEYNQYWKTVVQTMQDGLIVVDTDGTIVATNPVMENITGFSQDELIGQPCTVLGCDRCSGVRPKDGEKPCQLFNKGSIRRLRCTLQRKNGSKVHVLKNAAVLHDESGQVVGGVETLTDLSEVVSKEKVIKGIRRELGLEDSFHGILGKSRVMRELFDLIQSAAVTLAPVLILGESGTGKELVANAIHHLGPRAKGPFIKVNCAALNQSLLESELFGHVKGAFTGADHDRMGRFQAAHGGDFFLDEVGDLPTTTQVKLLRVLQEKVIEKVGDHRPVPVDVRFISATNQNLEELVEQGSFRKDLYYRVAVVPIRVPPLRERREDIPLLTDAFVRRISSLNGKPAPEVSRQAMEALTAYHWPGNVRELLNVLEYALVLCKEGPIKLEHLPSHLMGSDPAPSLPATPLPAEPDQDPQRQRILEALRRAGGKKTEAARLLGISRVTLWKHMKKLGIEVNRFAE